jgi:two-component system, NarL family, nitrate/nitrite response regulator NarL
MCSESLTQKMGVGMSDTYRFAVVDDHPIVLRGIIESLLEEPDFDVVGEGRTAEDAVRIAREAQPHFIVLDVNMPGSGVEAAAKIRSENPSLIIVMFSFRQDLEIVRASLQAGASGYLIKGVSGAIMISVIRRLLAGEIYIDPIIARRLV